MPAFGVLSVLAGVGSVKSRCKKKAGRKGFGILLAAPLNRMVSYGNFVDKYLQLALLMSD